MQVKFVALLTSVRQLGQAAMEKLDRPGTVENRVAAGQV